MKAYRELFTRILVRHWEPVLHTSQLELFPKKNFLKNSTRMHATQKSWPIFHLSLQL